jgi:hypothetical protein
MSQRNGSPPLPSFFDNGPEMDLEDKELEEDTSVTAFTEAATTDKKDLPCYVCKSPCTDFKNVWIHGRIAPICLSCLARLPSDLCVL